MLGQSRVSQGVGFLPPKPAASPGTRRMEPSDDDTQDRDDQEE